MDGNLPAIVAFREGLDVDLGPSRLLRSLVRGHYLLLSVAGAVELEDLAALYAWFESNLMLTKPSEPGWGAALSADLVQSADTKGGVLGLLRYADMGVTDAHKDPPDPESVERVRRAIRKAHDGAPSLGADDELTLDGVIRLTHLGPTGERQISPEDESQGTQAWLRLIGPVLSALNGGTVLLVDELDASLHPHLVRRLLELFQDERTNPYCAQLVFNSHDTGVLGDGDRRSIGRDQIWFTKKDLAGVASLYPLTDFAPRHDDALERRYLQGRYGAVPAMNPAEVERALDLVDA